MAHHSTYLKLIHKAIPFEELHLKPEVRQQIDQLLEEFTYRDALDTLDIPIDNKILLYGHTGCGKTATAHAIGMALNKPVITVDLSGFVSSKLGETSRNLAELFKKASNENGVLFIDEFDFVGKLRDYDEKDSGEMKRLVNTLIQLIDSLDENALLICATNHVSIIDSAILRRFQIKLGYDLPGKASLDTYYDALLERFPDDVSTIERHYNISYAEAKDRTHQQVKQNVIAKAKKQQQKFFGSDAFLNNYNIDKAELSNPIKNQRLSGFKWKDDSKTIAVISRDPNNYIEGTIYDIKGEALVSLEKSIKSLFRKVKTITETEEAIWLFIDKNSF